MYTSNDHTFVICAYQESPFLEDCIRSVLAQTVQTHILIETSTPCAYIAGMAEKYHIPMVINSGKSGCASDWNYGYEQAKTELVTITHQDDIYEPRFAAETINYLNRADHPILAHTDYYEIRGAKKVSRNSVLTIKRILNHRMRQQKNWNSSSIKIRSLALGNRISCPTVTLVRSGCGSNPYDLTYQCSCDYKTWSNLSRKEGSFVYVPMILMGHQIYEESHTSIYLKENVRQKEDMEIISSYWPHAVGKVIYFFYSLSQRSNHTSAK